MNPKLNPKLNPKQGNRWNARLSAIALPLAVVSALLTSTVARGETLATPLREVVQITGLSGGDQPSACGFLPERPSLVLTVTEPFASLEATLQSEGNVTLFIEGPGDFSECRTTDRFNPGTINAPGVLNQGVYRVYVGNESSTQTPYTLSIRQN
jgi:hypothetical protein